MNNNFTFNDKAILITGGTGSFGKAFVKYILDNYEPKRLVIFSRDELKQFEMQQDFNEEKYKCLRFFIGDVRDRGRLEMAMRDIDYVIHAAALKQVPAAEYNPFECIHTNVIGAENVVQASIARNVKKVIALSTDKAASPINLYGASKLASDKIFVAANHLSGADGCRFSVVRYGNVMGSRGSVIPFFNKLVKEKASFIPITDAEMTRFWITLKKGVGFVSDCLGMMYGGEIFIPKIPSMKISDLATFMAPDIPQKIIGIRPGEKLHETMITTDDARYCIELDACYVIEPNISLWDKERKSFLDSGGKQVENNFSYVSNTNTEWIDKKKFLSMLEDDD
jgi:UDP-N-acetylglucosamine 4,6-dehydratase